ncbi:MAG: hypothetical protein ACLPYS_14930 [Vulcanimicrobiaceae bacterium]
MPARKPWKSLWYQASTRLPKHLVHDLVAAGELESQARSLVERMALIFQAALLVRHSPPFVAGAFCASRVGGEWGHAFGTLPRDAQFRPLLERAFPTG